ncbi:hypothetical protein GCM10020331_037280 [Ectobacillus funiculus]
MEKKFCSQRLFLFVVMGILGIVHFVKGKLRRKKGIGATVGVEWSIGIIVMVLAAFF